MSARTELYKKKLDQAMLSSSPYPINLKWMVDILKYKHISSLTTHLKRHFVEDEDYKRYPDAQNKRNWTYFISLKCFRKICHYSRHSERKMIAKGYLARLDQILGADDTKPVPKVRAYVTEDSTDEEGSGGEFEDHEARAKSASPQPATGKKYGTYQMQRRGSYTTAPYPNPLNNWPYMRRPASLPSTPGGSGPLFESSQFMQQQQQLQQQFQQQLQQSYQQQSLQQQSLQQHSLQHSQSQQQQAPQPYSFQVPTNVEWAYLGLNNNNNSSNRATLVPTYGSVYTTSSGATTVPSAIPLNTSSSTENVPNNTIIVATPNTATYNNIYHNIYNGNLYYRPVNNEMYHNLINNMYPAYARTPIRNSSSLSTSSSTISPVPYVINNNISTTTSSISSANNSTGSPVISGSSSSNGGNSSSSSTRSLSLMHEETSLDLAATSTTTQDQII